jgi:hypothetical protein
MIQLFNLPAIFLLTTSQLPITRAQLGNPICEQVLQDSTIVNSHTNNAFGQNSDGDKDGACDSIDAAIELQESLIDRMRACGWTSNAIDGEISLRQLRRIRQRTFECSR